MLKDLNQLIDCIKEHLIERFSYKIIAENTGISEYQLKHILMFIAEMSLMDYIKNRRLVLADRDLLDGSRATEAVFKYGYETVEGSSRAFRDRLGYLPSEISRYSIQKSLPRLTSLIDIRGGKSMRSRIKKREQFHVVGMAEEVLAKSEGVNQEIQELAQTIMETQREEMYKSGDLHSNQVIDVPYGLDEDHLEKRGSSMRMIGFTTTKENLYASLEMLVIEERIWAIFPSKGPFLQTLQGTWGKIHTEWLPSSDYELVEAPEIFSTKWREDFSDVYNEIRITVKVKK